MNPFWVQQKGTLDSDSSPIQEVTMIQRYAPDQDEIDLFDILRFLGRNAKLILGFISVGLIIGIGILIAVNRYTPPLYEADTRLKLGRINFQKIHVFQSSAPLCSIEEIKNMVFADDHLLSIIEKSGLKISPERLRNNVRLALKSNDGIDILRISVTDASETGARNVCQEISKSVFRYLENEISRRLGLLDGELKVLSEKEKRLRQAIERTEKARRSITLREGNILNGEVLTGFMLDYYQDLLTEAELEEKKLRAVLDDAQPHEDKPVSVSVGKAQKRLRLIPTLMIFGVFSAGIGIIVAFFKDGLHKRWRKES
jgi:capsular polysaccharide biosynthesis protein